MLEKHPFITKDELERITKKYPTPFHIYDEAEIVRRVHLLQKAFSWNPGFREFPQSNDHQVTVRSWLRV